MQRVKKAVIGIAFAAFGVFLFCGNNSIFSPQIIAGGYIGSPTGEELFKANCARCHGNNGEGGKGPNLTTEGKKAKWKDSDEKIVKQIQKGGFFMPSFRKKLTDEEIRSIAAYVRDLPSATK